MTITTKILVVEDDMLNREMLARRLQRCGFEVLTARDGHEAVEMSRTVWPALILMDLTMPGLSGWEAAQLIKADPLTEDIPIIALTAHVGTADRERALKMGCDAFETKPVDIEQLLHTMRAFLLR